MPCRFWMRTQIYMLMTTGVISLLMVFCHSHFLFALCILSDIVQLAAPYIGLHTKAIQDVWMCDKSLCGEWVDVWWWVRAT